MDTPTARPPETPASPPPQPAGRRRRRGWLVLGGVLALAGAYCIWWTVAAEGLANRAEAWIDARRAAGYTIGHGGWVTAGFPFALRLTLMNPVVAAPEKAGGWRWTAPALTLETRPWRFDDVRWRAPGRHRFQAPYGSGERRYELTAGRFDGRVVLTSGRPARVEADIGEAMLKTNRRSYGIGGLHVVHAPAPPAEHRLPLSLRVTKLRLSPDLRAPLGDEIARLTVDLSLEGPLEAPVANGGSAPVGGRWPAPALAWRDAGGVLEIKSLGLAYGPLNLTGRGTAAIDPAGQPEGAFTARVTGFAETLDILRQAGIVAPGTAATVQVVLGLLASGPANGPKTLDLPVTLQDRWVSLGAVRLFRLKPVDWFATTPGG